MLSLILEIRYYGIRILPIILILTKILSDKLAKNLKEELDFLSELRGYELWDAILEEAKKGNTKAKMAIFLYWMNTVSGILFVGLIILYI